MSRGDWEFQVQDWRATLASAEAGDLVYCDPPYVGRHADYFSQWSDEEADALAIALRRSVADFAYSMWAENKYRKNEHLERHFNDLPIVYRSHFYHVGATEDLRNEMKEALVMSPGVALPEAVSPESRLTDEQLSLV